MKYLFRPRKCTEAFQQISYLKVNLTINAMYLINKLKKKYITMWAYTQQPSGSLLVILDESLNKVERIVIEVNFY